jgi:hypothetical protein
MPLGLPTAADELRDSTLLNQWWYYSVELLPGAIAEGIYPASVPMLPRLLMRHCSLKGMECLDLGTMEGLIPVLMVRGGAKRVVALDGADHCLESSPRCSITTARRPSTGRSGRCTPSRTSWKAKALT